MPGALSRLGKRTAAGDIVYPSMTALTRIPELSRVLDQNKTTTHFFSPEKHISQTNRLQTNSLSSQRNRTSLYTTPRNSPTSINTMPPKKATATKAKATTTTKTKVTATVKTKAPTAAKAKAPALKVTKKAAPAKSAAKTASATTKASTASTKTSSAAGKKRKASSSETPAETRAPTKPAANEAKKRKSADEPSTQADEAAARPVKKARVTPKAAINTPPTTRLNIYVCGEGSSGELGLGTAKNAVDVKRPRLNPNLSADTVGVVQIAVGGMHCAALTHDNKILTWGVNDQGALGRDTNWEGGLKDIDDDKSDASEESDSGLNPKESIPTAIASDAFPEGTVFVEVAAGDSTTFALTDDGNVYGWGTFRVSPAQQYHLNLAH